MNSQEMTIMGSTPTIEQLEEQIVHHWKQMRALHFEIAKRKMEQSSQTPAMSANAFQGGFQGVKSPVRSNAFNQQVNGFGQQPVGASSFGQPFGHNNTAQVQANSYEQIGRPNFGQPSTAQSTFGQPTVTRKAYEQNQSQSSMSFEQLHTPNINKKSKQKRSFGHPSQSSLGPERTQHQPNSYERPKTAPLQPSKLTPNGRMINKNGNFLGRVQAVPTEGYAVSIKRLGKPKFFDYKTVAECLQEWKNP